MLKNGIPVSVSLASSLAAENIHPAGAPPKERVLTVALLAVAIAVLVSGIAKLLIYLINLVTNLSFFGHISAGASSPANNHLGLLVIIAPAAGGVLVGLMAF